MPIQRGIAREIRYKKQPTYGVAPGATGAQVIRRMMGTFDVQKPAFSSQEMRTSQQRAFLRTGQRGAVGQLSGELSPGTYKDWIKSSLRQGAADLTFATTGALTNITASASAPHFVRAAGSFISDGFKIGDVVIASGWTSPATGNNGRFYRITALNATQMTVADIAATTSTVTAKASGDSVTIRVAGRKMMTPKALGSQSKDYYYIENWFSEITQSEIADSMTISTMQINMPPNQPVTIGFGFVGRDVFPNSPPTSQYFTSPTAQTGTDITTSLTGSARFLGGSFVGDLMTITSLSISLNNDVSAPNVAFSQVRPDNLLGMLTVSGQGTILFEDGAMRDAFINETDLGLILVVQRGPLPGDDAIILKIDKLRITARNVNDNAKELTQSFTFECLENVSGGPATIYDDATLVIQDTSLT